MKKYHIRKAGELVRVVETVQNEYFLSYQDSMIMLALNYLSESQKLRVLRYMAELTGGKILKNVPMQLPEKADEAKILRTCTKSGKLRTDDKEPLCFENSY